MKLPAKCEYWDTDEPDTIIITLKPGWSFYHGEHLGVSGFDTAKEARAAIKGAYKCKCQGCLNNTL